MGGYQTIDLSRYSHENLNYYFLSPGKQPFARHLRNLGLAARICQDLDVRIVKTYYCQCFEKLID